MKILNQSLVIISRSFIMKSSVRYRVERTSKGKTKVSQHRRKDTAIKEAFKSVKGNGVAMISKVRVRGLRRARVKK